MNKLPQTQNSRTNYIEKLIKDTMSKHDIREKSKSKPKPYKKADSRTKAGSPKHKTNRTQTNTDDYKSESQRRKRAERNDIQVPNTDIKDFMSNSAEKSVKSSNRPRNEPEGDKSFCSNASSSTPGVILETRIEPYVAPKHPMDLIAEYRNTISQRYSNNIQNKSLANLHEQSGTDLLSSIQVDETINRSVVHENTIQKQKVIKRNGKFNQQ